MQHPSVPVFLNGGVGTMSGGVWKEKAKGGGGWGGLRHKWGPSVSVIPQMYLHQKEVGFLLFYSQDVICCVNDECMPRPHACRGGG